MRKDPARDEASKCPDDEEADGRKEWVRGATTANGMHDRLEAELKEQLGEELEKNLRQQLNEQFKNEPKHALSVIAVRRALRVSCPPQGRAAPL